MKGETGFPSSRASGAFPELYMVEQKFQVQVLSNVEAQVREELLRFPISSLISPGQRVAVGVGSRGIHDLVPVVRAVVGHLKECGLRPYIIPAMGSHGGATAQGQAEVLKGLGVTESSVGAPVRSNMEVLSLGRLESGLEVFCARDALLADHLVVINRVKPHTAFRGPVESGLCKMLAVGLGRKEGAALMHRYGLGESIVPAALRILEKASVLFGLAILESPTGGTCSVRVVPPSEFPKADQELLEKAWEIFPRVPVEKLDVLLVERMGKDISGAGMDPNVIGLWRREGGPRIPDYKTVVVLDLTPASHGNATGIGMADLTTRRLMSKVDLQATYTNALTSGVLRSARLPIPMSTDMEALQSALAQVQDVSFVRMARIRDTLNLERFWVSRALLPELKEREGLVVHEKPTPLLFDEEGSLLPLE